MFEIGNKIVIQDEDDVQHVFTVDQEEGPSEEVVGEDGEVHVEQVITGTWDGEESHRGNALVWETGMVDFMRPGLCFWPGDYEVSK